jgi:hypothetical protein
MLENSLSVIDRSPSQIQARETLAPSTFREAVIFAEYLACSTLVPQHYVGKPANIIVAMQYGMEIGLPIMQALQSIAVINGRPSMWGDGMLAVVMQHPAYEKHEEYLRGEGDALEGVFEIQRRGHKLHTQTFSMADAKRAGLLGKQGPWSQYTGRMLKLRARGFALRDKFPDALRGIVSREESEDSVIDGGTFAAAAQAEPLPTFTQAVPDLITKDQAREFGSAYKASGYTPAEAQEWCKANLGVSSTLKIPASSFTAAMTWAATVKETPAGPTEDETECLAMMEQLGMAPDVRSKVIAEAKSDWPALRNKLRRALDEESAQA